MDLMRADDLEAVADAALTKVTSLWGVGSIVVRWRPKHAKQLGSG